MFEHKTVSLAEQVYEYLENDILSGKYKIGEYLTEQKLVQDMGVSRTPIREALQKIENEHLIEVSTKGILVIGISEDDLKDIYQLRKSAEVMVAEKACEKATEKELSDLKSIIDLQEFFTNKQDPEKIRGADSEFHKMIYRMSKSRIFIDVLESLHRKIQKFRKASVQDPERAKKSFKEHLDIYNAMLNKDVEGVKKAMLLHIENAEASMIKRG